MNGETIPVVFIPRKPHPNGLLLYLCATFINHPYENTKLPYILDILPHLKSCDISPHSALNDFLKRYFIFLKNY